MQNAGRSARETRRVLTEQRASSAGLDAYQLHAVIADERVEQTDRVAASSDAGKSGIRQAAFALQNLGARLDANHAMKVANHYRIRMRSQSGTQQVIGIVNVRHPVAHRLANGVL